MKVLVLGSNGFFGKNLAQQFAANGHDVLAPVRQELNLLDQEATETYLCQRCSDVVVNCAITIQSAETNLNIYYNIERCSKHFGRLINIGSGAEYANKYYVPMMTEDYFGQNVPAHTDTYGLSKFCIAKDIEKSDKNIINLRGFGVFGEHEDHTRRFITNNICSSIRNQTITVNRNSVFDYIDIYDFGRITEIFFTLPARFKSYNACTATPISLVELAGVIDRVSGLKNTVTINNGDINSIYTGDNQRMLAEISPFEFTPIETSVKRLFAWYEAEFSAGRIA
jgi:UDP-glucose 4-epimerase